MNGKVQLVDIDENNNLNAVSKLKKRLPMLVSANKKARIYGLQLDVILIQPSAICWQAMVEGAVGE